MGRQSITILRERQVTFMLTGCQRKKDTRPMDSSPYVVTEALRLSDVARKIGVTLVPSVGFLLLILFFDFGWSGNTLFEFEMAGTDVTVDPFVLLVVGAMVYGLVRRARPDTLLAVRSEGVSVGSASVPWSSIEQVVVILSEPSTYESDKPEVGLRLAQDAPLPDGLSSLVTDPSTPTDIPTELRTALGDQPLDREPLIQAVRAHDPVGISVVERNGPTERTLGTVRSE